MERILMANKRDRLSNDVADESLPVTSSPSGTPKARARRRFPTFTISALAALALLVAVAPPLISVTSYGPQLVSSAAQGQLDGGLEVESVRIGWLTSTVLKAVTV